MRNYNNEEMLLWAWEKKLKQLNRTKRLDLKNKLLKTFNQKKPGFLRLEEFNKQRQILLGDDHGQGWLWQDHFSGLWSLLSRFLPTSWENPQRGSSLRQALLMEPIIPQQSLLTIEKIQKTTPSLLDDATFEEALFSNPILAISELNDRINQKSKINNDLDKIFERLTAIKFRLEPNCYQYFLQKIFKEHPIESANYYYHLFKKNNPFYPDAYQFIEIHFIAETINNLLVFDPEKTIRQSIYSFQILLSFLSLHRSDDSFSDLLHNWNDNNQNTVENIYNDFLIKIKGILIKKHPFEIANLTEKVRVLSPENDAFSSPDIVLQMIFDYLSPSQHSFAKDPLVIQFSRLFGEKLILSKLNYPDKKIWQKRAPGNNALKFLENKLFHQHCDSTKPNRAEYLNLLSPLHSSLLTDYKKAEHYAIKIKLYSQSIEEALEVVDEYRRERNISENELAWFLLRIQPAEDNFVQQIVKMLKDPQKVLPIKDALISEKSDLRISGNRHLFINKIGIIQSEEVNVYPDKLSENFAI